MDPKVIVELVKGGGWKTYAAGILMILWAGAGVYLGVHGPDTAVAFFTSGVGLIGVRHKLNDLAVPQNVIDKAKE